MKTNRLIPQHIIAQLGVPTILEIMNHLRKMKPDTRQNIPNPVKVSINFLKSANGSFLMISPAIRPQRTIKGTLPSIITPNNKLIIPGIFITCHPGQAKSSIPEEPFILIRVIIPYKEDSEVHEQCPEISA